MSGQQAWTRGLHLAESLMDFRLVDLEEPFPVRSVEWDIGMISEESRWDPVHGWEIRRK